MVGFDDDSRPLRFGTSGFGLGLVATFAGPDLVTGPSGAPMVVAGSEQAGLTQAYFDGDACPSTLLFDANRPEQRTSCDAFHVVAYQLQPGRPGR